MISFFIPIRKGSKRIINKNLKKLPKYNHGLTELKIIQLKNLRKKLNYEIKQNVEFVVSTNCKEVMKFLKKFSWVKIHKRSEILSSDNCLDKLIKIVPKICKGNYILWTHVTSPLFDEKEYSSFLKKFLENKKSTIVLFQLIQSKNLFSQIKNGYLTMLEKESGLELKI